MKMEDEGEWASNIMTIIGSTVAGIFAIVASILGHMGLWPGADKFPLWATVEAAAAGVFFLVLAVFWFRMHRKQMRDS